MTGPAAEVVAVVLLAASLLFAVVRPRGLNELVVAGPAAVLIVAAGHRAGRRRAGTRCARSGRPSASLPRSWCSGTCARKPGCSAISARSPLARVRGDARRLLLRVVALAAVVTAILTLDATVVLLTPVVLIMARQSALPVRPHAYACTRLANSASLLLPVSNLTNLLAFGAVRTVLQRASPR